MIIQAALDHEFGRFEIGRENNVKTSISSIVLIDIMNRYHVSSNLIQLPQIAQWPHWM